MTTWDETPWSDEGTREEAARFLDAVNRVHSARLDAARVYALERCWGCSHPLHATSACGVAPIATREKQCGCPVDGARPRGDDE